MSTGPTSNFITLPNRTIVQPNGDIAQGPLKLHYWEWKGHQPTVLFCHAASFHGRCYDRIINEALHGYHVIALDFRGHGRSQQHPPPYRFRWLAEDVLEFIERLNLSADNLLGIGHSVGGYSLTWAAAKASRRLFQSLLLLDPVIVPPSYYGDSSARDAHNVEYILRRKNQWSSIEDMISRFENREPFSQWPKDTLRNYCTYAVDENCKLVCSPEGEASIYKFGMESDSNVYPLIEQSKFIQDIPIHIVRASVTDFTQLNASATEPTLVKWFRKGRDTRLTNSKHLFPMDQPQLVVDLVKKFIQENKKLQSHL
jgi:pimeloyl-ACP methyl ester carboxylesterase